MRTVAPAGLLWTLGASSSAEAAATNDWGLWLCTLLMLVVLGAGVAVVVALLRLLGARRGGAERES